MTGDATGSGPGGWAVIVGSAVSLDLTAVCAAVPEPDQIARMVGPLMSMVLRRRVGGHALIEYEGELHWKLLWDGTSTFLSAWPPGLHEWGGSCWDIELTIGERYDQSLLQMYVTGAAIALLGDGFLVDERNLITGGDLSGREKSPSALLTLAMAEGRDRSPQDVLTTLGSDSWGD